MKKNAKGWYLRVTYAFGSRLWPFWVRCGKRIECQRFITHVVHACGEIANRTKRYRRIFIIIDNQKSLSSLNSMRFIFGLSSSFFSVGNCSSIQLEQFCNWFCVGSVLGSFPEWVLYYLIYYLIIIYSLSVLFLIFLNFL